MTESDAKRLFAVLYDNNFDHQDTGCAIVMLADCLAKEWPEFPWQGWLDHANKEAWARYEAKHPYRCNICGSRYPTADILDGHVRKYHPVS